MTSSLPRPPFAHLIRLSDDVGLFEHARGSAAHQDHGYCADDIGRGLVVLARERSRSAQLERLTGIYLTFLERAQLPDGRFANRLTADERRTGIGNSDDATGRALQGLGALAANGSDSELRERALRTFTAGAGFESPSPRANAHAALGATAVLSAHPGHNDAEALLERAAARLGAVRDDPGWPWPERRLAYANALLADARIAAGVTLGRGSLRDEGLELLAWLVEVETRGSHFSFAPVGGWAIGEPRPGFDQQPIEAGTMAEACARAFDVTGDVIWAERSRRAARWFTGSNDVGLSLFDPSSGGCCDGLHADGRNENQGAESTLAMIAAFQQAWRLGEASGKPQTAARSASTSRAPSTSAAPTQRSAAPYVR